jgi:hypothetical protein
MKRNLMKQATFGLTACGLLMVWSVPFATADAPTLVGLDPTKDITIPFSVQAAYNDTQMFFNIEWTGDRGDTHDLVHYTGAAWQKDGGPRRDAQATIDDDPLRGPTNVNSTNYESRVTWMINDPNPAAANHVPGFEEVGCFGTCHDNSRAMPEWDPDTNLTKYLNDNPLNPNGEGQLDLWHHRQARANPIGMSDDQKVVWTDGTVGGRQGDGGNGAPYQSNNIVTDSDPSHGGVEVSHPKWVLNPNTSVDNKYVFAFEDVHTDANQDFMRPGDTPPISVAESMDYHDAIIDRGDGIAAYEPQPDDTVPRRRLRDLRDNTRGDITADGTTFTPVPNPDFDTDHYGTIESNTQRLLDTLDPDDTALTDGQLYDIAFGLHTGMVTVRDHYVSFPLKLSLGAGDADVVAEKLDGDEQPNWGDIDVADLELFLPGIASLEFLLNENIGKEYLDPATGELVDQFHAGAVGEDSLLHGGTCKDCHSTSGPGLSMANLVPGRGGVWTQTPLRIPEPATLVLLTLTGVIGLAVAARRRKRK